MFTTLLICKHGSVHNDWNLANVARPLHAVSHIAGPYEGDGNHDILFSNKLCAVMPPGIVDAVLRQIKLVTEYHREGNLYLAEFTMTVGTRDSPQKATTRTFYAKLGVEDIKRLRHTKVITKTDNERASASLKIPVARLVWEFEGIQNVQTESPPAHDSQSNAGVEIGVRLVTGFFKTFKLCLEGRIGT